MTKTGEPTPNSAIDPLMSDAVGRDGKQVGRSAGKFGLVSVYLSTALISIMAGYFWQANQHSTSFIYFLQPPEVAADLVFSESLTGKYVGLDGIEGFHGILRNAVIITEEGRQGGGQTNRYVCPQSSEEWGELELNWEWDGSLQPALGILELNMHVFPEFDSTAVAEMYLASEETKGRWVPVVTLNASTHDRSLFESIDVTRWVKNSHHLKLLYRLKANRLIYHPTPNNPVGFAGAQCLRHADYSPYAMKLSLWKDMPEGFATKVLNRKD